MPQHGEQMNADERKQRVSEVTVNVHGGMKVRAIRAYTEVHAEQSEVERAAVPDEGHDSNERRDECAQVQQQMHGGGEAARQYCDFRRERRRRVGARRHPSRTTGNSSPGVAPAGSRTTEHGIPRDAR